MLRLPLFLFLTVPASCARIELDHEWEMFKKLYQKEYSDNKEANRREIWENNLGLIERHNLEADLGLHTYRLGQNKYADMSPQEFQALLTGFLPISPKQREGVVVTRFGNLTVPDAVDWRTQGYVTQVKDQADCGACWSFASTGALEGQHFKKTGFLVSLSEQNLVDCSVNGNKGCDGGHMVLAFQYIAENQGVDTEESYPYVARQEDCKFRREFVGATDIGSASLRSGSEDDLKTAVAEIGPISVGLDANPQSFHLYKSGVYSSSECSSVALNHAVLVVGYGTLDGKEYWLLKNSWGTSWGESGYGLMARNDGNMCGVATDAVYPLV